MRKIFQIFYFRRTSTDNLQSEPPYRIIKETNIKNAEVSSNKILQKHERRGESPWMWATNSKQKLKLKKNPEKLKL